jgi:hypothetical protein
MGQSRMVRLHAPSQQPRNDPSLCYDENHFPLPDYVLNFAAAKMRYMTHQQLREFARSKRFGTVVNYAIVSFAIIVGLETLTKDPQTQELFHIFDFCYVAFFTFEIAVRILAEDRPWMYFRLFTRKTETENGSIHTKLEFAEHGFWNYFDFLLIALSIIGLLAHLFVNPAFIQIGRMFRIFRIIRLLDISEHLKEVERRIISMIPTVRRKSLCYMQL